MNKHAYYETFEICLEKIRSEALEELHNLEHEFPLGIFLCIGTDVAN